MESKLPVSIELVACVPYGQHIYQGSICCGLDSFIITEGYTNIRAIGEDVCNKLNMNSTCATTTATEFM